MSRSTYPTPTLVGTKIMNTNNIQIIKKSQTSRNQELKRLSGAARKRRARLIKMGWSMAEAHEHAIKPLSELKDMLPPSQTQPGNQLTSSRQLPGHSNWRTGYQEPAYSIPSLIPATHMHSLSEPTPFDRASIQARLGPPIPRVPTMHDSQNDYEPNNMPPGYVRDAGFEVDRDEYVRDAGLEVDRDEYVRDAGLEVDRDEYVRGAGLERDRDENVRGAGVERDRDEHARGAGVEMDRDEYVRDAGLEFDENAYVRDAGLEIIENEYVRDAGLELNEEDNDDEDTLGNSQQNLNLAILPGDYPSELWNTVQLEAVQQSIFDLVQRQNEGSLKPEFDGFTHQQGWLCVSCNNASTVNWLRSMDTRLRPWVGASLQVVPAPKPKVPARRVFFGIFPALESTSIKYTLHLIEGQNEGLNVHDWRVQHRSQRGPTMKLTIAIDAHSAEMLRKRHYQLNYSFGNVRFRPKEMD